MRRTPIAGVAAVAMAVVLAGCASQDDAPGTPSPATSSSSPAFPDPSQFSTPSSRNDIAAAGLLKLLVGKSADRLIQEEPAIAVREFFGMDKVLFVQTFHNVHHEGRIAGQLNHVLRKLKQKPSAKDGELCQRVTLERIQ